jgi:prepilin-type N-terminal cleavage/methylation domain-containing protein
MLNKLRSKRSGFTLVEIMIVVAIIALLASVAVAGFLRARKRSQASKVINDLRMIDSSVEQYAIEFNKQSGTPVPVVAWTNYLKTNTSLYSTGRDVFDNDYGDQEVDQMPMVPTATFDALSDVADSAFFSPYRVP